jgi:hypothetical protein
MVVRHMDVTGLEKLLGELRVELEPRRDIEFAYVYGSVLQGAAFCDVDVALWTTPDSAPDVDLDIGRVLSARTGLSVDVRRINEAPDSFLFHVLRGVPLVVRDEARLADLIERTARQYHDLAPLRLRAVREAFVA